MNKSEAINELATALSKAQSEIENASKDSKNPHFNSKYASLASVLNEARKALTKHGLSIVQTTVGIEGRIHLETTLMHSSGQFIQSSMPLILNKQDMQGLGSAMSYARRYSIASVCGISQEDDDANKASEKFEAANPSIAKKESWKKSPVEGSAIPF